MDVGCDLTTIIGASKLGQLQDNLASLDISLSTEQVKKLNEASALESAFFTNDLKRLVFGGVNVQGWR